MNARRAVIFAIATLAGSFAVTPNARAQADTGPTSRPAAAAPTPLERANADAVAKLQSQIISEHVDDGITIAQILDRCGGLSALTSNLNEAEQVGGPRYVTEDLVQVQRQISGPRVASIVRDAVNARPDRSPIPPARLDRILRNWEGRSFTSTGNSAIGRGDNHSSEAGTGSMNSSQPVVSLPDRAPDWSDDSITASAFAPANGPQLRTARAAERQARATLRTQVGQLKLDDHHTLADLAAANAAAGDRIDRAVDGAGVSGIDYHADGSVEIRLSLDGQRLWQSLQLTR